MEESFDPCHDSGKCIERGESTPKLIEEVILTSIHVGRDEDGEDCSGFFRTSKLRERPSNRRLGEPGWT